jgi:hypothetical protein
MRARFLAVWRSTLPNKCFGMEMQYGSHANISHQLPGGRDSVGSFPVASIILQIPPTSATSERNWSLFGNTHTKARNRLTNTRIEKLVTIAENVGLFEPDNEPSSTMLERDSEDEASESDVQEVDIEEVQGADMEA